MINVTSGELETILARIEEARVMHEKWRNKVHRILACKLPPEVADMSEHAYQKCAFGQWLYSKSNANLRNISAFVKIDELHRAMHDGARNIFSRLESLDKVPVKEYDLFVASMGAFDDALAALQQRVSYTLQNIDSLTGAFKQVRLLPDLTAEQERLKLSGATYSLLMLDIDLKEINQNHGHSIGDEVLRASIFSIRDALSAKDKIYRYSGAEFVICLPGQNMDAAELIKEKLLKKIGEALVAVTGEAAAALRIHYGIVELDPNAYIEELIGRSGRSTYTINL